MTAQTVQRVSVLRLVLVIFLARTILNIGYRAVYPFLPFIAADLGVSFQSAAGIIQSRNLVGLAAPLFGPLSDHLGRRTVMFGGLALAVIASLALGLTDMFWVAVAVIAAVSLSKAVFDPAQQAYMGDRVAYTQRGRAIALSEVSWSAAALIGLPLFGIAVQYAGWRAGFVILGGIGLVMLGIVRFGLPGGDRAEHHVEGRFWDRTFGQIIRHPLALVILISAAANAATNENVNVVFGEWLEGQFSLGAIALGTVASAIGVAELAGELVSSGWADRIGKHRLVQACLLLSAGAYALLPFIGRTGLLAAAGLVLAFFFFEITVVAAIPLVTEVLPTARATLLSLNVAAFALGRLVGSFTGPFLYSTGGIMWNGLASAGAALFTFALWTAFVREQGA